MKVIATQRVCVRNVWHEKGTTFDCNEDDTRVLVGLGRVEAVDKVVRAATPTPHKESRKSKREK